MKKLFILPALIISYSQSLTGQDTLFYENFNDWDYVEIDSIFTNFDEDNISDYNGLAGGWFVGNFGNGGSDSTESVALSSSWLANFQPGTRNPLRLPALYLPDALPTFSWRSAPALGNLYLDGYTVVISTDPDFYYYVGASDCDTLMHFAQNLNNDELQFSSGTQHDSFDSLAPINISTTTQYPGKLKTWEVSLAAYAGQSVYISFLHNSDDDNFIAIDDILVKGTYSATGINNLNSNIYNIYPNPTSNTINIDIDNSSDITSIEIYNAIGQRIHHTNNFKKQIDISEFQSGVYFLSIETLKGRTTKQIIKE